MSVVIVNTTVRLDQGLVEEFREFLDLRYDISVVTFDVKENTMELYNNDPEFRRIVQRCKDMNEIKANYINSKINNDTTS